MFIKFNAKNYMNIFLKCLSIENFIQAIKNIIKTIQLESKNKYFYNNRCKIYSKLK